VFENNPTWEDAMCDICAWPRLHALALELVEPGVMDKSGLWVDGFTKEKSEKWGVALAEASARLKSRCLKLWTVDGNGDFGHICRGCLQSWLDTPDKDKT
jgi:hypothetical protein